MGLTTLPQMRSAHSAFSALNQFGLISPRTASILAVLVLMLVVPLWWSKSKKDGTKANAAAQTQPTDKPQPTAQAGMANTPATTAAAINPDRFGLSFGHLSLPNAPSLTVDIVHSVCNGTPLDMANPDKGQCNPIQGDSSCRTALPVLCVLQDGSTAESVGLADLIVQRAQDTKPDGGSPSYSASVNTSAGWVGGTLGATAPVAGFVLGSLAAANARCTKELGTGWRMAELHDGKGTSNLLGKRGPGLANQQTRHWVYANDQKSNYWDPS
jgi:hypothetical protein